MLFEKWQRAPEFLMNQVQTADVMKKNAELLLDQFTACFSSSAGAVPELGLGNAETKVSPTYQPHEAPLHILRGRYRLREHRTIVVTTCTDGPFHR